MDLTGISNWILLSLSCYLLWGTAGLLIPASLFLLAVLSKVAAEHTR